MADVAAITGPSHRMDGNHGPLIDGSSCFYKPLQPHERGPKDVLFYTSFPSNPNVPNHIRLFFSAFHGTVTLPTSDSSGPHPHLVLDDLVHGLSHPSLLDLKIGSRDGFGFWKPDKNAVKGYVSAVWRFMSLEAAAGSSMDCALAYGSDGVNALLSVMWLRGLVEGSSPIGPGKAATSSSAARTSERPSCSTAPANGITSST
ncbi:hypothetical protein QJS10_CPA09g01123 [Acorus calamus]|uniref:Inositol polyphosphate multikinase n=1 Tax=Acorus calamus TaxID=4465 RepID=A0AAV9E4N8_ACOCL|nr:hypothetical protein QJS10_CPA09g01123 [Acorus calamus]